MLKQAQRGRRQVRTARMRAHVRAAAAPDVGTASGGGGQRTTLTRELERLAKDLTACAHKSVWRTALWMYRHKLDQPTAEDLVHDTWTVAMESLRYFSTEAELKSFFTKAAKNLTLHYFRDLSREPQSLTTCLEQAERQGVGARLEHSVITHDLIEKALAILSDENRQIVLWYYVERLTLQEIGQLFKLTEEAVKQRLYRSRLAAFAHLAQSITKRSQE